MMYHCIAIAVVFPSDTKDFEDVSHTTWHQPVNDCKKTANEKNRGNHHSRGRNHIVLARPGHLLHFHAHVVHEFARVRHGSRNPLADSCGCSGDGVAARLVVLHFYRLRGHETLFTSRNGMFSAPSFSIPRARWSGVLSARPSQAPNSGRGGGIRTPIPGFGDPSPNRWTTPLNRLPLAIHPQAD